MFEQLMFDVLFEKPKQQKGHNFNAQAEAEVKGFPCTDPNDLYLQDCVSLEYTRKLDGYVLKAVLAKAGDTKLYEKDFYCYHFLREYETQKERDKEYDRMLKKIITANEAHGGTTNNAPEFETLYHVSDNLHASLRYAASHSEMLGRKF